MTNVEAMDVPAYARKMNESVAPFKAEYATKSADAVEGAIFWTRADRMKTRASSPMTRPKKTIGLEKIVCVSAGEPATPRATAAVIPSPTNIQP